MMRLTATILLAGLCVLGLVGCGKTSLAPTVWTENLEAAQATARREHKLLVLAFLADWSIADKMMVESFKAPEVRALAKDFVHVKIDCTDDELEATRKAQNRFNVIGVPTVIVMTPDLDRELLHLNEYAPPDKLAAHLRSALVRR